MDPIVKVRPLTLQRPTLEGRQSKMNFAGPCLSVRAAGMEEVASVQCLLALYFLGRTMVLKSLKAQDKYGEFSYCSVFFVLFWFCKHMLVS